MNYLEQAKKKAEKAIFFIPAADAKILLRELNILTDDCKYYKDELEEWNLHAEGILRRLVPILEMGKRKGEFDQEQQRKLAQILDDIKLFLKIPGETNVAQDWVDKLELEELRAKASEWINSEEGQNAIRAINENSELAR